MTDAQTILKMIEEVDTSDAAEMDDIDTRVHEYLGFHWHGDGDSIRHKTWAGHWGHKPMTRRYCKSLVCDCESDTEFAPDPLDYTRSRDALKSIRPDGWHLANVTSFQQDHYEVEFYRDFPKGGLARSVGLPTEELAELHAIIQAIEYERSVKNAQL